MPPIIDAQKCIKCGLCAAICGLDVYGPAKPKTVPQVKHGRDCWHCNACVLDCPVSAIKLKLPLSVPLLHIKADGIVDITEVTL